MLTHLFFNGLIAAKKLLQTYMSAGVLYFPVLLQNLIIFSYTIPCAFIASTTFSNPAILAPAT